MREDGEKLLTELQKFESLVGRDIISIAEQAVVNCRKEEKLTKFLLDLAWEKLNTGHWKDVEVGWRFVYALASWFHAQLLLHNSEHKFQSALKAYDMGLLMGVPLCDNLLSRRAAELHAQIVQTETECRPKTMKFEHPDNKILSKYMAKLSKSHQVERLDCPSLMKFDTYLKGKQAIVVENAMTHWPAMEKWSVDYIHNKLKYRTVPVEVGSRYTDADWSQQLITVDQFVNKFMLNSSQASCTPGYLAQHQLFDQIPELYEDIPEPDYCSLSLIGQTDVNCWFGPASTVSPLHQDPRDNLLCQVFGAKYVKLISDDFTQNVYPMSGGLLTNTSEVDVEDVDAEKYPKFSEAPYSECILEAGQMLYIPKGHWHFVRSLSHSFSVSFWFG